MQRRLKIAAACGAIAGAAVVGTFGPLVRSEAARAASRYGATVTIEGVAPSWLGVRLRGVEVQLADVPSARIHLEELDVQLGGVRRVAIRGGLISAVGPRDVVIREAEAWRARRASSGADSGGGTATETEVSNLDVSWRDTADAPTEAVTARNVRVSREGAKLVIGADEATITAGSASVAVKAGEVTLMKGASGYRVGALVAAGLSAELVIPEAKAEGPERPAPTGAASATPQAGAARPASARTARPAKATPQEDEAERPQRGRFLKALLVGAANGADGILEPGADVRLDGVRAKLRRGDDTLNLGPGSLAVTRGGGRLLVELAPGAGAGEGQALTFRLSVPLGAGEGEIVADVAGGPIGLGALGVQEADFGLLDVTRTSIETRSHVVLSGDGKRLSVDGSGKVHQLSLRNAALSDEPVLGLELAWRGKGELELDGSRIKVDDGEVDLGAIRVLGQGTYERSGRSHRVRGEIELPLTGCQSMLESAPRGLVPKLDGMRLAGSFALKGKATFDTARLDRDFDLRWDVSNSCRVTEAPPAIHVDRFKKPFKRQAYTPEGRPTEIEVGPSTPGWVPYGAISRFMETAVLTTEDGGFLRHHGFDEEAIRNSIRENLRARRFVRGASTISMQLAKNVYLDRGKNLSRKLQEAVLTMYLEQELTKEQIMELYLNVVEFGPMVYGVGPAARHYFNASAAELSLGQALYMSSILPNPNVQHFSAGGAVTPQWMAYLHKLMEIGHRRNRVTDEELEDGLRETVLRGSPAPHRAPRDEKAPADHGGPEELEAPDGAGDWIAP